MKETPFSRSVRRAIRKGSRSDLELLAKHPKFLDMSTRKKNVLGRADQRRKLLGSRPFRT